MHTLSVENQLFPVPSEGQLYDFDLIGETDVRLRSIVASDQKQMASDMSNQYRMYIQMLTRYIIEPEKVPVDQLLLSDAVAILYAVYLVSHGPDFQVRFSCEYCRASNEKIIKLTDLEADYASDRVDDDRPFDSTGKYTTESGDVVHFHLPRVIDERRAKSAMDQAKKRGKDMSVQDLDLNFYRLATYIDRVELTDAPENDESKENAEVEIKQWSVEKREVYVEQMAMRDYQEFQEEIREADTGLRPNMKIQCGRCIAENDVSVILGANFFRPPKRR